MSKPLSPKSPSDGTIAAEMLDLPAFNIKTAGEILNEALVIQQKVLENLKSTPLDKVPAPQQGQLLAYLSKTVSEGLRNVSFAQGGPTERVEGVMDRADFLQYLTKEELVELEELIRARSAKALNGPDQGD